jgi:hypothetical protein
MTFLFLAPHFGRRLWPPSCLPFLAHFIALPTAFRVNIRLQFRGGSPTLLTPLRLRGGWHASKSGAVELASALFDACLDVRRVALDPIPEIGLCGPHDLVSLSRK